MKYVDNSFTLTSQRNIFFRNIIVQIQKEVDAFYINFADSPKLLSGWGHRYFCSDDGGKLKFDYTKPNDHSCSICGRNFEGKIYDEAWNTNYRNLAFITALKSAVVYRSTGDSHYLDVAINILSQYVYNYLSFPIHNKDGEIFDSLEQASWGCGRLMPQGLNESIVMVRAIETLEILGDSVDNHFLTLFHERFVKPFYQLIIPQVKSIHNISCWNLSGLGAAALYFYDQEIINFVFSSKFNIREQLHKGVTEDGFWYEGSIHYNFFLLEGVSSLMVLAHVHNQVFGLNEEEIIVKMLQSAYAYAFDNQMLPDPNDGWPGINLKTYSYVYYMVSKVYGEDSLVGNLVKNIENSKGKRGTLPLSEVYYVNNEIPLERLLFAYDWDMKKFKQIKRSSVIFEKSNFAILRKGDLNLFFKYGLNGPSHAHPDILSFELAYGQLMISRDLSNAGYYSRLCNIWHRNTPCHNTITRNGENITSREPGHLQLFTPNSVVASSNLFVDVLSSRKLVIDEHHLNDTVNIIGKDDASYDLFLHIEKDFTLDKQYQGTPSELGYTNNGYDQFSNVRKYTGENYACFTFHNGKNALILTFFLENGEELFLADSPDNPASHKRFSFIRRKRGKEISFSMKMEIN